MFFPDREELKIFLHTYRRLLSPEDQKLCFAMIERAERRGLGYEVMLWAFNRRLDEDFELVQCLNEGLLEWDI